MASLFLIFTSCFITSFLTLGLFIRCCCVVIMVEGMSMFPTLERGDRVLVLRSWPPKWLRKGHIVVLRPWLTLSTAPKLTEGTLYIKRIVGLGGETITSTSEALLKSDDVKLYSASDQHTQQTWFIPKGYIFVRGDNHLGSVDSLRWGPIPVQCVLGVVMLNLSRRNHVTALRPLPPFDPFAEAPGLPAGQDAPPFEAQTLSGETVTLATYKGRAVVFLFITPRAIPTYAFLAPKAAQAGAALVFVSTAEPKVTCALMGQLNINLPILIAPRTSNPFLQDYHFSITPAYCFINEHGKVESAGYPDMRCEAWKALAESWGSSSENASFK
jgi:signal peptidase I